MLKRIVYILIFIGLSSFFAVGQEPDSTQRIMGLIEDGDVIRIDAEAGTVDVKLSDDELAARKAKWKPRPTNYDSGALQK